MSLSSRSKLLFTSFLHTGVLFLTVTCAFAANGVSDGIQVQTFQTHSRILFSVDASVEAHLKSSAKGFEIFFKDVGLSDLGAPLGEEHAWAEQFSKANDPRLASLSLKEMDGGVQVQGVWKFPTGKQALANPLMDTFEYRQSTPAHYVLDFWLKQGSLTRTQMESKKKAQETAERQKQTEEEKRERAQRKLASEKRMAEVEDTTRFCKESLTEKNDVFLRFNPVHEAIDFKQWFPTTTPDSDPGPYKYAVPEGKSESAQYTRLALDLYQQGKFALTLRTLDFFDKEQVDSPYRREMSFLRANTLIKLGMPVRAEVILRSLMSEAKDSPEALCSAMYLAYQQIAKGNSLGATESLLWLEQNQASYVASWVFHLGVAEQLYSLSQTDRALKEYEWVVEKSPSAQAQALAGLRSADLYLQRFQYDQALAGYFQSLHYFEKEAQSYPPLYLNRAESMYGLGQYDRAKEAYTAFLAKFPGYPGGWRATYRLAEMAARDSGEAAKTTSQKWYYDTINQFPFSPGATLSRLRLLPCGNHGGFNYEASEKFFSEDVANYTGSGEVEMIPFKGLAALSHIRTLISFSKDPQAVDAAIDELGKPSNLEVHDIIRTSLNGIFRKSVLGLLAAGKQYEALDFYKEKSQVLPKTADYPEETDYLLKLSEAASDLGLGSLAKQISDHYAQMNKKREVASTDGVRLGGDLEERLQSSEQHFAQAKALWTASGMQAEASVREHLGKVQEESPFSYEREVILALMDQKHAKNEAALSHAVKAQLLKPNTESVQGKDLRVQAWIADLQAQVGDKGVAFEMYRNLEKHLRLEKSSTAQGKSVAGAVPAVPVTIDEEASSLGIPPMPSLDVVMISEGHILEAQGRWGEAAATYARAMEDGIGGDQVIYQYARSLKKTGQASDRVKAHKFLEQLAAGTETRTPAAGTTAAITDDFWKKLAKETLADEKTVP
jgi:tetratricopeptide (TPR) repeat protein